MAEHDDWTPAFPGQRRPFEVGNEHRVAEGNTLAQRHGAYSSRTIAPLAAEIEEVARADWSWPAYLTDPSYAPAVAAWSWAEATCELLRRHLADQTLDDAMADTSSEESSEVHEGSRTRRTSSGRRVASTLTLLDRWERTASQHRARLGLDPLSRAKLGRDVTSTQADLVQLLTAAREHQERGDQS